VAGLICLKPEARSHLFYRMRIHRGRKGERRSMSEADYAGLITAAHHELHDPLIVIRDNLNTHVSAVMHEFTEAHPDWLTVIQLPAYAPDLNPVEGLWVNTKNGLGNLAACTAGQLAAVTRTRLKRIQRRPALINGFLCSPQVPVREQPQEHSARDALGLPGLPEGPGQLRPLLLGHPPDVLRAARGPGARLGAEATSKRGDPRSQVFRHVCPFDGEQVRLVHAQRWPELPELRLALRSASEHCSQFGFRDARLPRQRNDAQSTWLCQPRRHHYA
jgi:hypothetical protein